MTRTSPRSPARSPDARQAGCDTSSAIYLLRIPGHPLRRVETDGSTYPVGGEAPLLPRVGTGPLLARSGSRAVELARLGDQPVSAVSKGLHVTALRAVRGVRVGHD